MSKHVKNTACNALEANCDDLIYVRSHGFCTEIKKYQKEDINSLETLKGTLQGNIKA